MRPKGFRKFCQGANKQRKSDVSHEPEHARFTIFADPRIVSSLTPSQPVYKKLSATGGHAKVKQIRAIGKQPLLQPNIIR